MEYYNPLIYLLRFQGEVTDQSLQRKSLISDCGGIWEILCFLHSVVNIKSAAAGRKVSTDHNPPENYSYILNY